MGSLGEINKEPGTFAVIHAKYSKICTPIKSLEHKSGQGLAIGEESQVLAGFDFCPPSVPMLPPVSLQRRSFSPLLYLEGFSPVHHDPSQGVLIIFYE